MEIDNKVDLTREEIKTIVHGLRMSTLSFVEDNAVDEIEAMIKVLPLPEEIDKMDSIKGLQGNVGKIMRLIEIYSKRDMEYKTRYKSRTGLPPRYKVLDWSTKKMEPHIKASLVQGLIKISEGMEEEGKVLLSKGFIDCAKKVAQNKYFLGDLYFLTKEALKVDNGLRKEAQALTDINLDFSDITNGLQNVSGWFRAINSYFDKKYEYLSSHPKTQKFLKQLTSIWGQVKKLGDSIDPQIPAIQQTVKEIENSMETDLVPREIRVNGKRVSIILEDDPTEPGYQRAVINYNGKKYEVQENQKGERSLKEVVVTPTKQPLGEPTLVNIEQEKVQEDAPLKKDDIVPYGPSGDKNKRKLLYKNDKGLWVTELIGEGGQSKGGRSALEEKAILLWKDYWKKYAEISAKYDYQTPTQTPTQSTSPVQPITSFNLKKYKNAQK